MFPLIATTFTALLAVAYSSRLVDEQLKFYETILRDGFGKDNMDADGLVKLLQLKDGHPKYNHAALEYITSKWGSTEVTFEYFHKLINLIYGDEISDDPFEPQELHLAYTNDPTSMKIIWVTMENLEKPFVQFMSALSDRWELAHIANAANYTYSVPAKWWPVFNGVIYEVDMTGLTADSHYKYRVGGWDNVNQTMRYSAEFPFKAAPLPNDPNRATRVFTGADHGTFEFFGFETVRKMAKVMPELRPDFAFIAGDLSYAGIDSEFKPLNISKDDEFELIWDLLGIQNQPISAKIPWMIGVGNHEAFYNFTAVSNRYKMPQTPALNTQENFWYTFTYGNIQWVSISSEHDLSEGSPQLIFLRDALTAAQNNRATVPWIILSIHKPIYCSVEGSPSFAGKIESLLLEFDVDLTIAGHMHAYERIHPVRGGEVSVYPVKQKMASTPLGGREVDVYYSKGLGPVHCMQGHAGGVQAERWTQPPPAWSAFRMADGIVPRNTSDNGLRSWFHEHGLGVVDLSDETTYTETQLHDLPLLNPIDDIVPGYNYSHTFGFGFITTVNATHLHYQAIPNVDGLRNHDEFWIVKER